MLKVTNRNDFDFHAKFNNRDFLFPKGATVAIDDEAAAHIFGLGETDKTAVLARHGWAAVVPRLEDGREVGSRADGMRILNNFSFQTLEVKLDVPSALNNGPRHHADDEQGPAPLSQETAGAKGTDGPAAPVHRGPVVRRASAGAL